MEEIGLGLCRRYFETLGRPVFEALRSAAGEDLFSRLAFGLAGEGSDCFAYDDEFSRDHDWGPAFSVWYDEMDPLIDPAELRARYALLPQLFEGFERLVMPEARERTGPCSIQAFYKRLIGRPDAPETLTAWLNIPESALAAATNGKVFADQAGLFTAIRTRLQGFYPEDIRLKKLAARLVLIGQSGQYNVPRCIKRQDWIGARHAVDEFIQNYISCAHLLEFKYRPYYKWAARSMSELSNWGEEYAYLLELSQTELTAEAALVKKIEFLCAALVTRLQTQNISDQSSDFLPHQAARVQSGITDATIRALPLMLG